MNDYMETGEQTGLGPVGKLDPKGYIIDPVKDDVVESLVSDPSPPNQELGEYLQTNNGFGQGAEYQGRLARAREAVGLGTTSFELPMRQQFEWEAGDVIDLDEFLPTVEIDEEVQITDYKDRHYQLVKKDNGFEIIGAYHANNKPILDRNGRNLEGKTVTLGRYQTETDRKMTDYGIMPPEYIRLAEIGTVTKHTEHGEEYIETKDGRTTTVSAARLLMEFDEGWGYGILASKIKLIPHDHEEKERLQAAKWRIRDSIRVIEDMVEDNSPTDPIFEPEVELVTNNSRFRGITILESGEELRILEEKTGSDEPIMFEYSFSIKKGGSKKTYTKAGGRWVVPMMPGLENDGSVHLSIFETAREIDKIRYTLQEAE